MIVEHAQQHVCIASAVRLVGTRHQQGEVAGLGIVAREVGMDALGDITKQRLQAGRRIELLRLLRRAMCGIMRLPRTLAALLSPLPRRVGVVQVHLTLGDARVQLVQLRIQHADLPQIAALKDLELRTQLRQLRLTLGQCCAYGRKLLALVAERGLGQVRLQGDLDGHTGMCLTQSSEQGRASTQSDQRTSGLVAHQAASYTLPYGAHLRRPLSAPSHHALTPADG